MHCIRWLTEFFCSFLCKAICFLSLLAEYHQCLRYVQSARCLKLCSGIYEHFYLISQVTYAPPHVQGVLCLFASIFHRNPLKLSSMYVASFTTKLLHNWCLTEVLMSSDVALPWQSSHGQEPCNVRVFWFVWNQPSGSWVKRKKGPEMNMQSFPFSGVFCIQAPCTHRLWTCHLPNNADMVALPFSLSSADVISYLFSETVIKGL